MHTENAFAGGAAVRVGWRGLTTGKLLFSNFPTTHVQSLQEYLAGLCPLTRADDASLLENIHHPRSTRVAEA